MPKAVRNAGAAALLGIATTSSACFWVTTKAEGAELRNKLEGVEKRLARHEESLGQKLTRLEQVLEEATKLLQRNSADLGADLRKAEGDIRELRGLLATARHQITELQSQTQALHKQDETQAAALEERTIALGQQLSEIEKKRALGPDELYRDGKTAFDGKQYEPARQHFGRLVASFPGHDRADDAQYYRGESYYRQNHYDEAIGQFQKVWDKFPRSSLADDALFRAAEAAAHLKRCTEARAYLSELRRNHAASSLAKTALKLDRQLKRQRNNKKRCDS